MGILKLMNFIQTKCPSLIKHSSPLHFKNKIIAIDSPSTIYKFLVKTITSSNSKLNVPMDSQGNQTGHLLGIMYRALLCMEVGLKPIWVFDGVPPTEKISQLKRRKSLKQQAQNKAQEALDLGDLIEAARQTKRTIKISKQQLEDTQKMLKLMGMPTIRSYGEAQAQCSWLSKNKLADGVMSEDLDTLAFGAELLVRNFGRDKAVEQIQTAKLLQKMNFTYDQFIDFCILCGCDYTVRIANIGPVKAYNFIKQHKNIQNVMKVLVNDQKLRKRHQIPDNFNYLRARQLFKNPLINDTITKQQLEQKQIDYQGLRKFLSQKQFDQARVQRWIKIAKSFKQNKKKQQQQRTNNSQNNEKNSIVK